MGSVLVPMLRRVDRVSGDDVAVASGVCVEWCGGGRLGMSERRSWTGASDSSTVQPLHVCRGAVGVERGSMVGVCLRDGMWEGISKPERGVYARRSGGRLCWMRWEWKESCFVRDM